MYYSRSQTKAQSLVLFQLQKLCNHFVNKSPSSRLSQILKLCTQLSIIENCVKVAQKLLITHPTTFLQTVIRTIMVFSHITHFFCTPTHNIFSSGQNDVCWIKVNQILGFFNSHLVLDRYQNVIQVPIYVKIFCFQFKGRNQPYHQPFLKFPLFLPAGQQETRLKTLQSHMPGFAEAMEN